MYRQCSLASGNSHQVAWIPEEFAKEGQKIRLADSDKIWDVVYTHTLASSEQMVKQRGAFKRWEKVLS